LDLKLPDGTGVDAFDRINNIYPGIPAIIVTGFGTTSTAFAAGRKGIRAYLDKPVTLQALSTTIDGILNTRGRRAGTPAENEPFDGILGTSSAICEVRARILEVGPIDETVLVDGETGTGKELVARSLHARSRRAARPFLPLNCGAIPDSLIESELFGHERGAFTGAVDRHAGVFEAAAGGTVFLDEIGELPYPRQQTLLRFLDDRAVRRVGGTRLVRVDVRIIVGTNRDLRREVQEGGFRQDLFYRLNRLAIHLLPLRDRREDIAPIAEQYLAGLRAAHSRPEVSLSAEAIRALEAHDWPGNVRELEGVMLKAFVAVTAGAIAVNDLGVGDSQRAEPTPGPVLADGMRLHQAVQEFEAGLIRAALAQHPTLNGAARALGIDQKTLYLKERGSVSAE
jgi:two-component system nitrogen regulation response regulator GlnG